MKGRELIRRAATDSFDEMRRLRDEMDSMLEGFWERRWMPQLNLGIREPPMDIEDKKDVLLLTTELPGIDKKDICINVEEERVEIKAEKKKGKEETGRNFYRQERSYRGYYRSVPLPTKIDPHKAGCSFENGLLKISLPKVKMIGKKGRTLTLK